MQFHDRSEDMCLDDGPIFFYVALILRRDFLYREFTQGGKNRNVAELHGCVVYPGRFRS
jgi:hypothetical protein